MNGILPFEFEGAPVRIIDRDGNPWWVLTDTCKAVGIVNAPHVASRLDADEKDAIVIDDSAGRPQRMTIISEAGLYKVLRHSRKPEAKAAADRFDRWVRHDVLPTIRKTGSYGAKPQRQISETRKLGIAKRKEYVGALTSHGVPYSGIGPCTNAGYLGVYGKPASELRKKKGLAPKANLRAALHEEGQAAIMLTEVMAAGRIEETDAYGTKECSDATFRCGQFVRQAILAEKRDRHRVIGS